MGDLISDAGRINGIIVGHLRAQTAAKQPGYEAERTYFKFASSDRNSSMPWR